MTNPDLDPEWRRAQGVSFITNLVLDHYSNRKPFRYPFIILDNQSEIAYASPGITNIAGYEPKLGDELVGDDNKIYRVERIIEDKQVVQLRCTTQPTVIFVAKRDLYNYFVGRAGE